MKDKLTKLTKQEEKTMQLICQGFGNPEIAEKLCISHFTVKTYFRNICDKFGIIGTHKQHSTKRVRAVLKYLEMKGFLKLRRS